MASTMSAKHSTDRKHEFHLEEYKALRAEIILLKGHQYLIQKWVIVTLGVLYGLAFGVSATDGFHLLPAINQKLLFFAGFVLCAAGAGFYATNDYTIYNIADYVRQLEEHFTGTEKPSGWEHFQGRAKGVKRPHVVFGVIKSPFWECAFWGSAFLLLYAMFEW
jgi:hypothetical protein